MRPHHLFSRGISLIEILIAASVIVVIVIGIASAWQIYLNINSESAKRTQSALLVEETAEALQVLRDISYSAHITPLALDTIYYLHWDGSVYSATTTPNTLNDIYVRTFSVSEIERDIQDNITDSGIPDPDSRKITVTIETNETPPRVFMESELLIHNVYKN